MSSAKPRRRPLVKRFVGTLMGPEKYLEVGLTPDEREIIVNVPMPYNDIEETIRRHGHHIVFSPDQARSLARLLVRKADECKK